MRLTAASDIRIGQVVGIDPATGKVVPLLGDNPIFTARSDIGEGETITLTSEGGRTVHVPDTSPDIITEGVGEKGGE